MASIPSPPRPLGVLHGDRGDDLKNEAGVEPQVPLDISSIQTNSATKAQEEFRTYDESDTPERVVQHYRDMRTFQTVEFYESMERKYSFEGGNYRCGREGEVWCSIIIST